MNESQGYIKVKNFGPVKEANIELNQFMLFIGPQGSGKSAIMKLLASCLHYFGVIKSGAISDFDKKEFVKDFIEVVLPQYGAEKYFTRKTVLEYNAYRYNVVIENLELKFVKKRESPEEPINTYIPAERVFFATFNERIYDLISNKIPIPELLAHFGAKWSAAKEQVNNINIPFLKIRYKKGRTNDLIYFSNKEYVQLQDSSSGIQATVPMYIIVEALSKEGKFKINRKQAALFENFIPAKKNYGTAVFIEEPEMNLFPEAQCDLVKFLSTKTINHHKSLNSLIISTHSPYILTSINNLIQASNANSEHPELKPKITKLLPESSWLNFEQVSAYYVDKGKTINILDKKRKMIGSNKIDAVTENISIEFDKLLDIKYAGK